MAREKQFDSEGRNLAPEWEGHFHTGHECICNDVGPEPRDEAPRWRWVMEDLGWCLYGPDEDAVLWNLSINKAERDLLERTLNAGERVRLLEERLVNEEAVKTTVIEERDALQERVRVLEAVRVAAEACVEVFRGGNDRVWALTDALDDARALAGTGEGATGCACSSGDQCSCPYDCDCRGRFEHDYRGETGWWNSGNSKAAEEDTRG